MKNSLEAGNEAHLLLLLLLLSYFLPSSQDKTVAHNRFEREETRQCKIVCVCACVCVCVRVCECLLVRLMLSIGASLCRS